MFRFLFRRIHPAKFIRPATTVSVSLSLGALAVHASSDDTHVKAYQRPVANKSEQTPLSSLLRSYLVFTLCSIPSLVDASPSILGFLSSVPVVRNLSDAFLKITFFDQFVGAETVDGCIPLLCNLRNSDQGFLFSYSVERPHGSQNPSFDASQRALESILHSIDVAADFERGLKTNDTQSHSTGTWVAIKLSTLLPDPDTLRVLSRWIVHRQQRDPDLIPFPGAPRLEDSQALVPSDTHTNDVSLPPRDVQDLQTLHTNLRKICRRAQVHQIRLTIDAEETWFQPAIDLYSILLMQEYNSLKPEHGPESPVPGSYPLVYTTVQSYLVRTPSFLRFLIGHARENEYAFGVKLVRGAYVDAELVAHSSRGMDSERYESVQSISPDTQFPIYPTKAATDSAYDDCVKVLIGEVARDMKRKKRDWGVGIGVLFGTHNWGSCRLVLDEILGAGLSEEIEGLGGQDSSRGGPEGKESKIILNDDVRRRVCMAQLYGMSDSLSDYIIERTSFPVNGYSGSRPQTPFVIRYVPYGPLRDVMPYLARRAVENKSVLGGAGGDVDVSLKGKESTAGVSGGGADRERKRIAGLIFEKVLWFWTV